MEMKQDTIKNAFLRHAVVAESSLRHALSDVQGAADILLEVVKNGGKVLACGNGGSAADAQHIAAEWICRYKGERGPLPAAALTVDTSAITAIGNDYGFDKIFSRQIEGLGESGDALVAITTSGKSPNILEAIKAARAKGLKVIGLTGQNGADLKKICDIAVVVPSSETARIQEIHELVIHSWCEYIDAEI